MNGSIAVAIAVVPSIAVVAADRNFRHYVKMLMGKIKRKLKKASAEGNDSESK